MDATLMMSGWSVSSMMMFIPESLMTSCNWFRLSLIIPQRGMKVLISFPLSWNTAGSLRPCLLGTLSET